MHHDCCCTHRLLLIRWSLLLCFSEVEHRLELEVEVEADHDPIEGLELDLLFLQASSLALPNSVWAIPPLT